MKRHESYDDEREAHEIRSAALRRGVQLDLPVARGLQRQRFSPAWVSLLLERAEGKASEPESMVRAWLNRGGWQDQVLFVIATRIGLWDQISDGGRFNRCRKLRGLGLKPWALAAIWNACRTADAIENPRAYVAQILKVRAWVQVEERIARCESTRHVTNPAVTNLVAGLLRDMAGREAEPQPQEQ